MATSSSEQRRKVQKRTPSAVELPQSDVTVQLLQSSSSAGPAFVNFPSVQPPVNTPFTIYSRNDASSSDLTTQPTIIAGETEDVEFFSTNRGDFQISTEGSNCSYLPALFDPSTQTLHVQPSTPLYLLTHRAKRLRNAPPMSSLAKKQALEWRERRNDLGEVFGTRKAKSQIKTQERNRVDVGAMEGVRGHLMQSIGGKVLDEGPVPPPDSIPVPNLTTTEVSEIYSRDSIIAPVEYLAIDVGGIMRAHDDKGRSGLLPWRRSRWIEDKMRVTLQSASSGSSKKATLRMCYYLSTLLLLHDLAPRLSKLPPADLPSKFPGVPQQLLNGCIERFTQKSGKAYTVSDRTLTKLLAWICVLYLSLNDWAIPVGTVASDLKLPSGRIGDIFKSLGAKVDIPSPKDREKAGLSFADAQKNKKAILKAPVEFPKPKRRGPVKR